MIQDTFKPVGIDKIVTDDLDFGTHIGGKKRENKWRSDDPNGLRSIVDEIRQEVGMNSRGAFPPGNSSKISNFMNHKLRGGDNDLIDGPEEYAFNKLHCREVDEPMERHKPTMKQTPKNDVYNREQYNYPYNAVYNNYQPDPEAYQENFSYKGYNQPRNNQYHGAGYNSDQASWYSYESYNSMGHPYYQGYQGNYDCGPQQNYGQPYYPNGPQHRMPTGQYVSRRVRKGAERDSPQMHPSQPAPIRSASPYSQGNNSYQEDEASESSDDEHANNSTSNKHSSPSKTKNQLKRFKQLIEAKPSNVLHVKGLENEEVSSELLNSLFSNFGNIIKILFVKHKQAAFIVYESQDLATISKEMLTNLRFMDCHLKVLSYDPDHFQQ